MPAYAPAMKSTNIALERDTANRLLSRAEAATYLGVRDQTLAAWAHTGKHDLPYVRVGRLAKYRQTDLDAWLARRTRTSAAAFAAAL